MYTQWRALNREMPFFLAAIWKKFLHMCHVFYEYACTCTNTYLQQKWKKNLFLQLQNCLHWKKGRWDELMFLGYTPFMCTFAFSSASLFAFFPHIKLLQKVLHHNSCFSAVTRKGSQDGLLSRNTRMYVQAHGGTYTCGRRTCRKQTCERASKGTPNRANVHLVSEHTLGTQTHTPCSCACLSPALSTV